MIVKTRLAMTFLLIQGGTVLDGTATPSFLHYNRVNDRKGFQVAVGCVNEFGKKEILGVVANSIPKPGSTYLRLSSEIDNANRRGVSLLSPAEIIRQRLYIYWQKGRFDDLCQLPQTIVVVGVE